MSSELILVTSLNGGCGKSTVCANLAYALSERNKQVLVLSLDKYCMSADLLFGCESSFLFDVSDFPESPLSDICIPVTENGRVSLAVSMPFSKKENTAELVCAFIDEAKNCGKYDIILVDKSSCDTESAIPLAQLADRVLIVSSQSNASVRSASLLGEMLSDGGAESSKLSLILNSFYTSPDAVEFFAGINEIMNETRLPLIGVVPFSLELSVKQLLAKDVKDVSLYSAFSNIAERIIGNDKKILDFLPLKNRRIILNKGCSGGNKI